MATITETTGDDILTGTSGDDTISAGAGLDTVDGGAGNDVLVVDLTDYLDGGQPGLTVEITNSALGIGRLRDFFLFNSVTFSNIEHLQLVATALDDTLTGLSGSDTLVGGAGDDYLVGSGGGDRLVGGLGNDAYQLTTLGDVLVEAIGEGDDTVYSGLTSYTLPAGVVIESLQLEAGALDGTGNEFNNSIQGNGGNNRLNGGPGIDTLFGAGGNDTYVVDNVDDVVATSGSSSVVEASCSYTLDSGVNRLTLTGTSPTNGAGNYFDNMLTGNTAANRLTGGNGVDTLNGGAGIDTLVGGAGDDKYFVDGAGDVVSEAAGQGHDLVESSASFTLGANLEDLTLTGTDTINATGNSLGNLLTGNTAANRLTGGDGFDILHGGGGLDTLVGGLKGDTYVLNGTGEVLIEAADEGIDLVESAASNSLAANLENLTLTGTGATNATGNSLDNVLTGNTAANQLTGGDGFDLLQGGGGINTLVGGLEGDTYVLTGTGDLLIEAAGEGTDLVESAVSHSLAANLEDLTLTGTGAINATGNVLNNTLYGNEQANQITGGDGNDTLEGDKGTDTLIGGNGDDLYYVFYRDGDVITEAASGGTDRVSSLFSFTLDANVENLDLYGEGNINATGNSLDNVLMGGYGANRLTGGAGNDSLDARFTSGTDTLVGGTGDDTYVVDSAKAVLSEAAAEGTDLVLTFTSRILSPNFENLTLMGGTEINATGNSLANVLTGNNASNVLKGAAGHDSLDGGAGADWLVGGSGNDTYLVNDPRDVVSEFFAEGTDLVKSSASYRLGEDVENLTLSGTSMIKGTGNALNNLILGSAGANTLDGAGTSSGAAQKDTLTGGAGADRFVLGNSTERLYDNGIATTPGTADYAFISDFNAAGGDRLQLKGTAAQYFVGSNPVPALSGVGVFFDSDGSGNKSAPDELIAVVNSASSLNLASHAAFLP